jgi:hypothetical protein
MDYGPVILVPVLESLASLITVTAHTKIYSNGLAVGLTSNREAEHLLNSDQKTV